MLLLIWLLFGCLNGSILALLQNTALRRDQQLTLECKVEDGFIGWFHIQVESNSEKPIFTPSTDDVSALFKGRAKVSRTNESHVLTFDKVQLSDAGTYGCKTKRNSTSVIIIERAQVIVLDGNIRIIRQNSSHILCEIDYNGSWRPELRLFAIEAGAKDAGHSADQPLSFNQSNGNRKKLVVLLERISFADNNHSYRCQLSFPNRSLPMEHLVTNVPAYEDSVVCGSDAVDDGRCAGSEQTTTTATRELPSDDDDGSGASSSSVVIAISLAVVCFFVLDIVAAVVFVSVRKRRGRRSRPKYDAQKRRTSKDSKSSSAVAPCPDILDRSEANNSSGFARRLPEIPSETFTYAEVLHDESIVDLSGGKGSRIVASDGTEYMLMNSVSVGRRPPFRMLPPPSAAPSMLYASIDHLHTETPLN